MLAEYPALCCNETGGPPSSLNFPGGSFFGFKLIGGGDQSKLSSLSRSQSSRIDVTSEADGVEATAAVCEKTGGYAITLDVGDVNGGVTLGASTDVVGEQYHHQRGLDLVLFG